METNLKNDQFDLSLERQDALRRAKLEATLWLWVGTLFRRRRLIIFTSILAAICSIVISLLLPVWYQSSTRLLAPESSATSPISAALLRSLPSAATAILGGGGEGDFERYISIMSSRTVADSMIERFDLINVYETADALSPSEDARAILESNVEYAIDAQFGYLSVSVYDQDPQRAADMANYIVSELNRINMSLAAQDASKFRKYVEQRFLETRASLDSLQRELQHFQEHYGVYDLQIQASAFLEQLATLRTEEIMLDIQYEALLEQYGSENPQVQLAQSSLQASRRKRQAAMTGSEDILPIPQSEVPDVMRQYLEIEQEAFLQKSILEIVAPLYDQARFEEEREFASVQVVDAAVPPARKAKPKRSFIVIMTTLSVGVLSVIYVFVSAWWDRNAAKFAERMRQAITPAS